MRISLTPEQINDLAIVRDLGERKLANIRAAIELCDPTPLRARQLVDEAQKALGDEKASAPPLIRLAIALQGIARGSNRQIGVIVAALRESLLSDAGWDPEQISKWEKCELDFLSLVACDRVRLVANALDLSYEYANLYRSGRILTDIRPLFNEDATAIDASVVAFTFRLRYQNLDLEHDLSIAMDVEDVKQLAEQCVRALRKAAVARDLQSQMQIPTYVTGEGEDE
ncbi:MAG: hypothetical protein QM775_34915 [Pirellulales bacterium]